MSANIVLIEDPNRVTQAFGFHEASKKITVTHYINLREGEDAYLEDIQKFITFEEQGKQREERHNDKTMKDHHKKSHESGQGAQKVKVVGYRTKFTYRLDSKDPESKDPFITSKKFPESGYPYHLSSVPHKIEVEVIPLQL